MSTLYSRRFFPDADALNFVAAAYFYRVSTPLESSHLSSRRELLTTLFQLLALHAFTADMSYSSLVLDACLKAIYAFANLTDDQSISSSMELVLNATVPQ